MSLPLCTLCLHNARVYAHHIHITGTFDFRNPPEEQGLREEWTKKTGWHRKEDIRLRGRTAPSKSGIEKRRGGHSFAAKDATATWTAWAMVAIVAVGLALCVPMKYGRRNIRHVARVEARKKKIADIV